MIRRIRNLFTRSAGTSTPSRPDIVDLIGEDFDRRSTSPARKTLIICSAPRTGSYELCRFLIAAGVGVPHEYFHSRYASVLAARWGLADPLSAEGIGTYIQELRQRRASNDLFATKLQFWQFDRFLRNMHGAALFEDALVVHLFRADVAAQVASFRRSLVSGRWDFSSRKTTDPQPDTLTDALARLELIVAEDAGFRRLFALTGINPMFVTRDDIARKPREVVECIARSLDVPVDEAGMAPMAAMSAPYPSADAAAPQDFSREFRARAFGGES